MKEAVLYRSEEDYVICTACKWYCKVSPGKTGICGARANIDGKLYLLTYGQASAVHLDPIEKKPLYHFLPGTQILSIGTVGCNFGCKFCQNWTISQATKGGNLEEIKRIIHNQSEPFSPEQAISLCMEMDIPSIAYTYNEPTIFVEYAHDIAKPAHGKGIRNVFVSSGYETQETMEHIGPYLDAVNIDLKAFRAGTYAKFCKTKLSHVIDTIRMLYGKTWMEITTLIVPGMNDSVEELRDIARFIASIDMDIPWHVTAFYPHYNMSDTAPTSPEKLVQARNIGMDEGLRYVYTGNIPGLEGENTNCPTCRKLLIRRRQMQTLENHLKDGKCSCGEEIKGIWTPLK